MAKSRIENLDTSRIALIMSVALDEFSRHRYQEASFNRIIKASQMAKGTMYYYFASKEDLFLTLYRATLREFNRLQPLIRQTPSDTCQFWQLTQELLEALQTLLLTKPSIGQFVLNFLSNGELQDDHPARETAIKVDKWLQNWLLQGQKLRVLRNDLPLARLSALCWGVWQAVHPSWTAARDRLDHSALILELMQRLLRPTVFEQHTDWPPASDSQNQDEPSALNF